MYICTYMHIYVHIYVYMYMYIYVCVYRKKHVDTTSAKHRENSLLLYILHHLFTAVLEKLYLTKDRLHRPDNYEFATAIIIDIEASSTKHTYYS